MLYQALRKVALILPFAALRTPANYLSGKLAEFPPPKILAGSAGVH